MGQIKYLIRKRALGDVLWIEPVIRQLAEKNSFTVYTKYPELFQNYPFPNVTFKKDVSIAGKTLIRIENSTRLQLFTVNLDNAYEKQPDIHFLHAYQLKAGLPIKNEYPRLYLSKDERNSNLVQGKYVLLHIESKSDKTFRQVYGVDWSQIVNHFICQGFKVVQIGLQPLDIENTIHIKTSIRELIALSYHASYFIGIDSGPSHIAASLQIPSLIFFGAINPLNRHFTELFKGLLMKKPCEYDDKQSAILNGTCVDCKKSDDPNIALCCVYSTEEVLSKIQQLMTTYDSTLPI